MLTSKVRFTFRDIVDGKDYCVDLLQMADGKRAVALRTPDCPQHEFAVRSTNPFPAEQVRAFLENPGTTPEVTTSEGEEFAIDAHRSWLLLEEALYWRQCRREKVDDWSDGPWVNGKMPKQYAP